MCNFFLGRSNLLQNISIIYVLIKYKKRKISLDMKFEFCMAIVGRYVVVLCFGTAYNLVGFCKVSQEYPEDGDRIFLRNVGNHLQDYTALQRRSPLSENYWNSHCSLLPSSFGIRNNVRVDVGPHSVRFALFGLDFLLLKLLSLHRSADLQLL
jgi:hypothetical protein